MLELFDLPAHPLLTHFPVVAIPVLAIVAIAMAVSAPFRRRYGWAAVGLAVVTFIATWLAVSSGNELNALFEGASVGIEEHRKLGQTTRVLVGLLTVALVAAAVVGRRTDRGEPELSEAAARSAVLGLSAVAAVLAVLSTVWVVRTGHAGAKATWGSTISADAGPAAVAEPPPAPVPVAEPPPAPAPVAEPPPAPVPVAEPPPAPAPVAEPPPPSPASPAGALPVLDDGAIDETLLTAGASVYDTTCARCHGADGTGTPGRGPALTDIATKAPDPAEQIDQVINGTDRMPAFGDRLTDEEVLAVVAYSRETF